MVNHLGKISQWDSSPINDFYSDSILSAILKAEITFSNQSNVKPLKNIKSRASEQKFAYEDKLLCALKEMFEENSINYDENENIHINVDERKLLIDMKTLTTTCKEDEYLEQIVSNLVKQLNLM